MASSPGSAADVSSIPGALHRHQGPDGPIAGPLTWPAAALFVDISGFTTLTEALAAHGPTGLEQLRTLLNSYFTPLSEIVRGLGGSIVRFEGDAVTAVFDAGDGHDALRAATCASDLRRLTADGTAYASAAGPIVIQTKIGVASGDGVSTLAAKDGRFQPVFGGSAVVGAAGAEGRARPGQIVLDPRVAAALDGEVTGPPADADGHRVLDELRSRAQPVPRPAGDTVDPALIVHPLVLSRLRLADGLVDEYRPVTVVFAGLHGSGDRPMTIGEISAAVTDLAPVVHDLDGEILTAIVGDKGSSLLLSFGAPSATDRSAARAVETAGAVSRLIGGRIGVASGSMFCGMIGGPDRSEYTVIGDTANTAARLMQVAAPGEVLVDRTTRSLLDTDLDFGPVRRLEVKGKVDVVECAPLLGDGEPARRPSVAARFVGRAPESARLDELCSRADRGRGGSALLHGPAGIGKSRLLHELVTDQPTVLSARFMPTDRAMPYGGLQPLFRRAIGLPADATPSLEAAIAGLAQRLPDTPPDRRRLIQPLVGASTAAPVDGPFTSSSEHGSDLVRALAVDVIEAAASPGPVLLAVEDVHRADADSLKLLEQLNRILPTLPAAAVYTSRREDSLQADEAIAVKDLNEADAIALAASLVGDEEATGLVRFAGGNPLALELAADGWDRSSDHRALPLTALALARVDALPARERDWFRRATAFVNGFDRDMAESMLGPGSLDELVGSGLLEPSLGTDGAIYTTRHGFLREAVYDTLLPGQRRELHQEIGERLEATPGEVDVFELAYHFGETEALGKQRTYFALAADVAEQAFSFGLAAEWTERLLPVVAEGARAGLHLKLGRWYTLLGLTTEAGRALRAAADGPAAVRSQALTWQARLSSRAGLGEAVEPLLDEAERLALRSGDREAIVQRTLVEAETAQAGANRDGMLAAARRLLEVAEGDPLTRAHAHHGLGTAAMMFDGDWVTSRKEFSTAMELAHEAGDLILLSEIRSDTAGSYYFENRLDVALAELSQAGAEAESMGYRRGVAAMAGNEALIRNRLGDGRGALELMAISAARLLEVGDHAWTLTTTPLAALRFLQLGDHAAARRLLEVTTTLAERADQQQTEAYAAHCLARVLAAQESFDEAEAFNARAGAVAAEIGYGQLLPEIAVLDVRIDEARGDREAALHRLDALAEDAPPPLLAQVLYERWLVEKTEDGRTAAVEAYRPLHAETPTAQTARRLTALTGEDHRPPDVPPNRRRGPEPTAEFFLDLVTTVEAEMDRLSVFTNHS